MYYAEMRTCQVLLVDYDTTLMLYTYIYRLELLTATAQNFTYILQIALRRRRPSGYIKSFAMYTPVLPEGGVLSPRKAAISWTVRGIRCVRFKCRITIQICMGLLVADTCISIWNLLWTLAWALQKQNIPCGN